MGGTVCLGFLRKEPYYNFGNLRKSRLIWQQSYAIIRTANRILKEVQLCHWKKFMIISAIMISKLIK